jgi:predicted ABC-type ATPase
MPELFVFAGCNGAGKSSLIDGLQLDFGKLINPDLFAREINPSNPRKADLTAGKMAVRAIRECLDARESFAVESTLSGEYILNQICIPQPMERGWRYGLGR